AEPKIAWKKIVYDILKNYNIPMTTDLLFHKIRITEKNFPSDRRFAIKNISSALSTLYTEGAVFRMRLPKRKDYIYGFINMFDDKGNLRDQYLKSFKLEDKI